MKANADKLLADLPREESRRRPRWRPSALGMKRDFVSSTLKTPPPYT